MACCLNSYYCHTHYHQAWPLRVTVPPARTASPLPACRRRSARCHCHAACQPARPASHQEGVLVSLATACHRHRQAAACRHAAAATGAFRHTPHCHQQPLQGCLSLPACRRRRHRHRHLPAPLSHCYFSFFNYWLLEHALPPLPLHMLACIELLSAIYIMPSVTAALPCLPFHYH